MKKSIIMLSLVLISVLLFAPACSDETTAPPDKQDIYEPNDTEATAASVLPMGFVYADLDPALDIDYFKVESSSSINLKFVSSSDLQLSVHITNLLGITMFQKQADNSGGALSYTVPAGYSLGTFHIMVKSVYQDGVGSYVIKLD